MNARRGERAGVCGGGNRRGWHGPAEGGGTHGVGYDGVPRGGGRGRCNGGGHFAAPDGVNQGDAPARRLVEDLRRQVENRERRLRGRATGRELLPAPDAP